MSRNEAKGEIIANAERYAAIFDKIEYDAVMYEKYILLTVSDFTVGIVAVYENEAIFSSEVVDVWTWVVAGVAKEAVDCCNGSWVVVEAIDGAIVVNASSFNGRTFSYGEIGGTATYPRPWFPKYQRNSSLQCKFFTYFRFDVSCAFVSKGTKIKPLINDISYGLSLN